MTDMSTEHTVEVDHRDQPGPGESLRRAREARKLTLETVARQLRLDVVRIAALEAEDFSALPAPIFVTGYVRSYARLLGLREEPLVAAFNERVPREGPPIAPVAQPRMSSNGHSSPTLKWGALMGGGVIAVALVLYWTAPPEVSDEPGTFAPQAVDSAKGGPPALILPELAAPAPAPGQIQDAPAPGLDRGVEESAAVERVRVAGAAPPATVEVENPAPAESPPVPAAPPAAAASLVFTVSAPSWSEVKDAHGKRLLFDMLKAGERRELRGVPPFQVLLGFAPGVTVEYEGQPFDTKPYTRRDVARFRVGEASPGQ
ncbi:MAG TPA: helix-turn-helix domain-containing protein [Gammaproteobacteria bacterium]|nr:helix-turn-helix domain-containing protein [Gammaproteobacteria bacterium]